MREFFLSGFTDEAADTLEGQIKITKSLGWKFFEARRINGFNIHDLDESAFEKVCTTLEESGIRVNCFGSSIANHDTPVDCNFDATMSVVYRAITRMKRLQVPYIRIMSYGIFYDEKRRPLLDQKEEKRFDQLRRICNAFLDAGLTPLHENAYNYGSMSWEHTLKLLNEVPGLRLAFDIGDAGLMPDFRKPFPYPNQSAWELWEHVKEYVLHFHIKDGYRDSETSARTYLYPGEGDCDVKRILADSLVTGYQGNYSIEPAMTSGVYDSSEKSSAEYRSNNFIEYGKMTEEIFRSLGCSVRDGVIYIE